MSAVITTVRRLGLPEAEHHVSAGSLYVDLRKVPDYLDAHVPGSICLQYEFGPGMTGRARDCIPLDVHLILLGDDSCDPVEVAAALRGKGFGVTGVLEDGLRAWGNAHGTVASTEIVESDTPPPGQILSVGDPGSPLLDGATFIPLDALWARVEEVADGPVAVIAGKGVRAAMAVGMLERAGRSDITFWRPSASAVEGSVV